MCDIILTKKGGVGMDRNDMVGYLLLNERKKKNSRAYWGCTCTLCGNDKDIREDTLQSGKTVSCGCYQKTEMHAEKIKQSHPIEDLTGNVYHELTVLRMSDKRVGKKIMCTCLCSCGKIVDVWAANLKNGNTKTCGDYEAHRIAHMKDLWDMTLDDLTGKIFGDWLVKERDGSSQPTRWICECLLCGTTKSVLGNALKNGQSTNCGCKRHNPSLTGKVVGKWSVGKRSKRKRPSGRYCTTYFCTCECGTQRYVDESRLLNGTSLSCGCVKSKANEYIAEILKQNNYSFMCEYSYPDLVGPGNGLLRFDFAILDNKNDVVCLIEYQGEQHYTNSDFGKQQREITDPLKKKYCKTNNIQLFEIKYTDNIDAKLDKIFTHIACQSSAKQAV